MQRQTTLRGLFEKLFPFVKRHCSILKRSNNRYSLSPILDWLLKIEVAFHAVNFLLYLFSFVCVQY